MSTGTKEDSASDSEVGAGTENASEPDADADQESADPEAGSASTGVTDESFTQDEGETDKNPSGVASTEGVANTDSSSSKPLTVAEVDRLYPYGMQMTLPDSIDPKHVVGIQQGTAEGSELAVELIQEPI